MLFKRGVLKNSANFTRKRLCWSLFLITLQAWRPTNLLKRYSNTGVFCVFNEIFMNFFFTEHLRWLLLYIGVIIYLLLYYLHDGTFNPIQDGPLSGLLTDGGMGGAKKLPTLKSVTYFPTMMALGTVTIYLKEIKKINKSRDTRLEFCRYQHFFIENQQLLLYQEIQIQIAF